MIKDIKVKRIKNGTVIDHIMSGQALNVLKILGIASAYQKTPVTVAMNVPSAKVGLKDIVKIEGRELKASEVDKISLISPNATINIIRDREVKEKKKVKMPKTVEGVLKCANPSCVTNFEDVKTKFNIEEKAPIKLRCVYCERVMTEEDVVNQF